MFFRNTYLQKLQSRGQNNTILGRRFPLDSTFLLIGGSAVVIAFYVAWSIGANDVANSMGTSVGSGAISLRQAILIAGIFEFTGAVLIGIHVTKTIQNGIVDSVLFSANPDIYVYGMLAALFAAAIWIMVSTYFSLPISTSQSIVGSLIGFGFIAIGPSAINWEKIIHIGESWVLSPISGMLLAFFIFYIIKKTIFDTEKPFESAKKYLPFFAFVLLALISFSFFKSLEHTDFPQADFTTVVGVTLTVGTISAIIAYVFVNRYKPGDIKTDEEAYASIEHLFVYLQVITACFVAFAHGSNDVANAIGPLAAVMNILGSSSIESVSGVPLWLVVLGGAGIVVGLATWGYKVIGTIGKKITEVTPTRGFSAEFSTALVVLVCSRIGLPVSTSQVLVGSVIGIGFAKGIVAVDFKVIRRIMACWVITVPVSAATAAVIFIILEGLF